MIDAATRKPVKRTRKTARQPRSAPPTEPTPIVDDQCPQLLAEKPMTKHAMVLDMLQQPDGATLKRLVTATGWLPHTTRAALTGLRKKGHALTSDKEDGVRRYRIVAATGGADL